MKWVIGNDHAAVSMKNTVVEHLLEKNHEVMDVGCGAKDGSVDYPDIVDKVVAEVLGNSEKTGILICGNGVGVAIRANRYMGIRAALVYNEYGAHHAKEHGNSNVLCFGERTMSTNDVLAWIDIYVNSEFEGGRHARRLDKLDAPLVSPSTQTKA